jgi:FixJ family two-component response regulator
MKERHTSIVFVVDDEVVIAQSLAIILERNGFSARFFTDPLEALAHVQIDRPNILISDVVMPQLSGIDLAIEVKTRCSDCKILLFSGQANTRDLLRDRSVQAHDFTVLRKPVHPKDLLREIHLLQNIVP